MSETVIRVEKVGKYYPYQLQQHQEASLRDTLSRKLWEQVSQLWFGEPQQKTNEQRVVQPITWALRNISFKVEKGENLALIGANGAGKTTLLKLLANITAPSEGWVASRGRVGSLFSLGTGFHPDMSGRENIYFDGVALGMSTSEIRQKFDAIVNFSELGQDIEMPVKYYSSGMLTRLGFSIFAHFEPEILLIDEALSAGDLSFRKKAISRLTEISNSGVTTVFVSHNLDTIRSLCSRAILLQKGQLIGHGAIDDVIRQYEESVEQRPQPSA